MFSVPIHISDFKPEDVHFSFSQKDGKKRVFVNKNESLKVSVKLQLCEPRPSDMLRSIFGISDPMPGAVVADPNRVTLELAVDDQLNGIIKTKLDQLNARITEYAHAESFKCFGKTLQKEQVMDRFTPPYREKDRSDLVRIKIPLETCELLLIKSYSEDGRDFVCTKCTRDAITKQSRIVPVVEISPMWFTSGGIQYGYSLVATNILVYNGQGGHGGDQEEAFVMTEGTSLIIENDDE